MKRKWFEDFIRTKNVDTKQLSELVTAAKGERSVTEFAKMCGVSTSTLTRIINQQTAGRVSDELLAQIALNAESDSGVTIVGLLNALGRYAVDGAADPQEALTQIAAEKTGLSMQDGTASPNVDMMIFNKAAGENVDIVVEMKTDDPYARNRRLNAYAYALVSSYNAVREGRQAVQESLLSKGFSVGMDKDLTAIKGREFNCSADFVITTNALEAEDIRRWAFIQLKEEGDKAGLGMLHYFGMLYLHDTDELATRVTFYTEDAMTYKLLRDMYHAESVSGSLSFMLIDKKNQKVISEYVMNRKCDRGSVRLFSEEESTDSQKLHGKPDDSQRES